MHKHFYVPLVILLGSVVGIFYTASITKADNSNSWLTSYLGFEKEADIQSLPSTLSGYGNIDCMQGPSGCSISALYGAVTNGYFQFNGTGSSYPVLSYLENRQRVIPIPNSNTAISYLTTPVFGLYFYFNHNFSSSLTPTFLPGTTQKVYQLNRAPDGRLADKSNVRLAADTASMSFSTNGRWMVVSIPNVAVARVNLQTFDVLPFSPKFDYGIALPPDAKTAISNGGRYAVVASKNQSRFMLYDLDTCTAVPDTISGPVSCQSRDLGNFMKQQIAGYDSVIQARFLNNDLLSIYASYKVSSVFKVARFLVSNTDITSQIDYLALGDSFISGEGAFDYQAGTDAADNTCHLSLVSYPYLIARDLNYSSYNSIACSGAIMEDITNGSDSYKGQADGQEIPRENRSPDEIDSIFVSFKPGYINQSDFVSRYRPKIINLSIVGNDIGFSKIVTKCAAFWNTDNCYESYEDRLELIRLINSKFPDLVNTYTKIKNEASSNSRIYIIGYPQIAKPGGNCAFNVHLSDEEARFSELIIEYLNTVIKSAADRVGAYYVDTQDAFDGYRLCEGEPGSVAINGLTLGNDAPDLLGGKYPKFIGNESYHPNDLGHRLLKIKILDVTNNLTDPMPIANPNGGPPPESGLEILEAPKQNRGVSISQYDEFMSDDLLFRGKSSEINVEGLDYSLSPGNIYRAELRSEPVNLGTFSSDSKGNLNAQVQVPDGVPIGFHTLHVYGTNIAGENIDIYKNVYVASNVDDYDGDGIDNNTDPCFFIEPAGQDYDQDGIDDACDGIIDQPPPIAQVINSEPESQPEETSENTENNNPTVVLSSTTNGETQPPVSGSENLSTTDVFSPGNDDKDIAAKVQSAMTASPKVETDKSGNKFVLKLGSLKQKWPAMAVISLTAVALLSLLIRKHSHPKSIHLNPNFPSSTL